jgi:hypothetical protein
MDCGQPVTGKRVPETVVRPLGKPGLFPDPVQFLTSPRRVDSAIAGLEEAKNLPGRKTSA